MTARTLVFAVWPYVALAVFAVGHWWRWRRDQFGWTSRTTQLLERRWLAWASPFFHFGALAVVLGHVVGILVPAGATAALGLSEDAYHRVAVVGGLTAGAFMATGLVILVVRRLVFRHRLQAVTTRLDWVVYALLVVVVTLGAHATIVNVSGSFDYRETVGVWFRSLFVFNPDVELMGSAPVLYQLHVGLAFCFVALWPFTRLVHVWSVPVGYLVRPYVVYRAAGAGAR
ncbi:MAG: respiratory nitrate reductase subunit gamma [Micrococcales bacterium]|nr:respiratory nitrate reductase subunit gamma [Micrococcales bacterium]MCL2667441.1 respiratory nitrate reductase subunit gamma [Micrococcales bacterium]